MGAGTRFPVMRVRLDPETQLDAATAVLLVLICVSAVGAIVGGCHLMEELLKRL